jgi:hypothetical protein
MKKEISWDCFDFLIVIYNFYILIIAAKTLLEPECEAEQTGLSVAKRSKDISRKNPV